MNGNESSGQGQGREADNGRRFWATFEQGSVGMAHTAPDGRRLLVNQRFADMLGYTRDEMLALRLEDVTHPDDYPEDLEFVRRAVGGAASSTSREKRFLHKDGHVVWATATKALIRKEDGTPDYFAAVFVDITDRKRAEQALRASERTLWRAQRIAQLGSWELSLDPAAPQLTSSPEVSRILGLAPSTPALTYAALLGTAHADDRVRVESAHRAARSGGAALDIEHRIVRPDGTVRWVHELGELERGDSGAPVRLAGTIQDITERRQAQDKLRMLSHAVEHSSESIVITDAGADIVYVNDACARISGFARDEVIGRNPRILHSSKNAPEVYRSMWHTLGAGRPWRGEILNRRKDGSEYLESVLIMPVREPDGRVSNYVAVKTDITERRRMEDDLERHQRHLEDLVEERTAQLTLARRQADAANKAKSMFLANMSHEIRTPMNGVLGMVEVFAHTPLTEQQAEMIQTIRESGTALLSIIDDILDLSKVEAGQMVLAPGPCALADLAEGVGESLASYAFDKGVDLSVFVSPEVPLRVTADDVRVRQVLYNLLGNAIKFSGGREHRRGRVSLRVAVAARQPLTLSFVIADNGIGMSEAVVASIFVPFHQGEFSTTRRFGGTGLGLALCKRLAEMMQGEIAVDSREGEGSTFTLTLPVDMPAEQPAPVSMPVVRGLDCIVLENPALDADGIAAYLTHEGARVQRASDAAECDRLATGLKGTVVVIGGAEVGAYGRSFAARGNSSLRRLRIEPGTHRRARIESTHVVGLGATALRRRALLRAVAIAAGTASPEGVPDAESHDLTAPMELLSLAEARERGQLILVAEDDDINRRVIAKQLELLGRTAELASDGEQALALWREGRHALLLTDLHMPRMDGYALTRAIRDAEERRASHDRAERRLPIIALTANALRGEAEHAESLGMDGYLTKPLRLDQLRLVVDRWAPLTETPAAPPVLPPAPSPVQAASIALNVPVLTAFIGDDPLDARNILDLYLRTARQQGAALRTACERGDARAVANVAHKLKSSSRIIGATPLADQCTQLEQQAIRGDETALRAGSERFETLLDRTCNAVEAHLASLDR